MIQKNGENVGQQSHSWQKRFLTLLPKIEMQLARAFRKLSPDAREEAVQETTVDCLIAFWQLAMRGKLNVAFPTVLTGFAVRRYWSGRRNGTRLNVRDVSSPYAQLRKRIRVESLDRYSPTTGEWISAMIEDRQTPIPDAVALRIDVPQWLATLSKRDRRIVEMLCNGHRASRVAGKLGISNSRISQIRRELLESWHRFHGMDVIVASA